MNNDILDEVIDHLKCRLHTLEKMMQDEGFQPIYKAAMKQEIIWLKSELGEINEMLLEDVRDFEAAEENLREMRAYAYI